MTGFWPLFGLAARRDRWFVGAWLIVLWLVCGTSASATKSIYPSETERELAASAINSSPGIVAMYGPILDVQSLGELAMTKMTVTYAVVVAVMMLFLVRRHTRWEEEVGLSELLAGTAISRQAPLFSTLAFASAVALILGAGVATVNTVGGLPVIGSLAFGAAWAGTALVGAGVSLVACQLASSARTCAAWGGSVLGALFVVRAIGDTTSASWLSWLSSFGWNTQMSAYSNPRWFVLGLYVATFVGLSIGAMVLARGRDLGAGVWTAWPGSPMAPPWLRSIFALDWRLHRTMVIAWTLSVAVLGFTFGVITPSLEGFDSAEMREILATLGGEAAFRDVLVAAILAISALLATCFGVAVIASAAGAEQRGLTEVVLATGESRTHLLISTSGLAVVGALWLLLVQGVAMAVGLTVSGVPDRFGEIIAAALSYFPASLVVIGVALLLFGIRRSWAVGGWAAVLVSVTLGQIGEALNLPDWLVQLSPYSHVAAMPIEDFEQQAAILLTGVGLVLLVTALLAYRRRNLG